MRSMGTVLKVVTQTIQVHLYKALYLWLTVGYSLFDFNGISLDAFGIYNTIID